MAGPFAALDDWRPIRRYAVPEWMIAECTEARERGDWRAACEAARVTVTVAPGVAGPAADLLAGLAPDLLRWHLPRSRRGLTTLEPGLRYLLTPDGPVTPATVVLEVRSPAWATGSQRLTLHAARAGDLAEGLVVPLPPHLWDARRAGELAPAPALPATGTLAAWAAAGWEIDGREPPGRMDPLVAARELRRVAAQFGHGPWRRLLTGDYRHRTLRPGWALHVKTDGNRHRFARYEVGPRPGPIRAEVCLHPALLRAPVDLDLVRHGRLAAAGLHPLVRAALFPAAPVPPAGSAAVAIDGERFRVRCGPEWHWIGLRGGRLDLPSHTPAEVRREQALHAMGGPIGGCFEADLAWRGGRARLPKHLRTYRRDLWRRMEHGGARVVLELLDAGLDPHFRDAEGRTLLHRLHQFEHESLLPRLLAAGLDVNARCRRGYTPMCEALAHSAPLDLLLSLNAAGAFPRLSLTDPATWPEPAH